MAIRSGGTPTWPLATRAATYTGLDIAGGMVAAARERQITRQGKPNAQLGPKEIETHVKAELDAETLLRQAISRLNLSARAYHRVMKVARSIADLAGSEQVTKAQVAEAIQYRRGPGT